MARTTERPLSPHLQVYRLLLTMVLSGLHRISGLWLSLCSLLLVAWLATIAIGPAAYRNAGTFFASVPMRLVLAAALAAFWYHLFAGIRHLAWDMDFGFELPAPRRSGMLMVALAAAAYGATLLLTPIGRWLAWGA
jgi:succinate dehydrogenase cytochrome b subunit